MSGDSVFGWDEVGFPYRNEKSRSADVEDVAASSIGMGSDLQTVKEKSRSTVDIDFAASSGGLG